MDNYQVKIIKPGYCREQQPGCFRADGTISLVSGPRTILVDTGGPWDKDELLAGLRIGNLDPSDVSFVVCTHGHSDHVGNINLFPEATIIVSHDISQGDLYTSHDFSEPYVIDDDVKVIATPGHTEQDVSVIVRTAEGTVAIAGDLFESELDLQEESLWRSISSNPAQQEKSRKMILGMADFIVPGHGELFAVP